MVDVSLRIHWIRIFVAYAWFPATHILLLAILTVNLVLHLQALMAFVWVHFLCAKVQFLHAIGIPIL